MASYPSQVATFTTHVNVTEIIDAGHPNAIQNEVIAIESAIGTTPSLATAATASGWANTATDYGTVAARLANIEKGIVADAHPQYLKNSVVTTAGDLIVGTGAATVTRLGIGSSNTLLTSNGSTLSWSPITSLQGSSGGSGTQGIQGPQGIQGNLGIQGVQGPQGLTGIQGGSGASGQFPATSISSNTSIAPFNSYCVTTTSSAITLTLPSSASIGSEIHIFDSTGNSATNNITIANNGLNINGQATSLLIDKNYAAVNLVYVGSAYGWRVS
jgi:hypothetical protein